MLPPDSGSVAGNDSLTALGAGFDSLTEIPIGLASLMPGTKDGLLLPFTLKSPQPVSNPQTPARL
jgi:hypothetical protein